MQVRYHNSPEELRTAFLRTPWWKRYWACIKTGAVMAMVVGVLCGLKWGTPSFGMYASVSGVFALLLAAKIRNEWPRTAPSDAEERTVEVDPNGVGWRTKQSWVQVHWSRVRKVDQLEDLLLIEPELHPTLIVPRRAFDSAKEADAFFDTALQGQAEPPPRERFLADVLNRWTALADGEPSERFEFVGELTGEDVKPLSRINLDKALFELSMEKPVDPNAVRFVELDPMERTRWGRVAFFALALLGLPVLWSTFRERNLGSVAVQNPADSTATIWFFVLSGAFVIAMTYLGLRYVIHRRTPKPRPQNPAFLPRTRLSIHGLEFLNAETLFGIAWSEIRAVFSHPAYLFLVPRPLSQALLSQPKAFAIPLRTLDPPASVDDLIAFLNKRLDLSPPVPTTPESGNPYQTPKH